MHLYSSEHFMDRALQLAEQGRFGVSPNPMVGCVLVKENQVISEGFHERFGHAHAEICALEKIGRHAKNATAYVTLEPCYHYGKTAPCVDALIGAGIQKCVIAAVDPNPKVSGKSIEKLRSHGIEVELGILEQKARDLNKIFFHYMQTKRPFVIAKWAMSLNGKTIAPSDSSPYISCENSRKEVQQWRKQVDAILIGGNTLRQDNPQLTQRLFTDEKQPYRVILSREADFSLDCKIFEKEPERIIIASTKNISPLKRKAFEERNISVWIFSENTKGEIDVNQLLDRLGDKAISSLLVEGGMQLQQVFFSENWVDHFIIYVAPLLIGEKTIRKIKNINVRTIDSDFVFTGE